MNVTACVPPCLELRAFSFDWAMTIDEHQVSDCRFSVSDRGRATALLAAVVAVLDGGGGLLHVHGTGPRLQDLLHQLHPQVLAGGLGYVPPSRPPPPRPHFPTSHLPPHLLGNCHIVHEGIL